MVHHGPSEVARAAADRIAALLAEVDGPFSLGLAGGTTPAATYRQLRANSMDWQRVDAWLSDERWVPPDDARSNGRMVAETLTGPVGAGLERPRWSDSLTAGDAAAHYEAHLRSLHHAGPPHLILLGLGADGHTASLFPDTQALGERSRWFVANEVPQLGEVRLTTTYPLLWAARRLMVLVVGVDKAAALKESMEGTTPAGMLAHGEAEVEWHVDRDAASLLD